jgi:hypothetical protein
MGEDHYKQHGAEAQATPKEADFGFLTHQVNNRFAPVILYGFTWLEAQGNKGFCRIILKC